jgi:ERCC4-type nuclease
MLIDFREDNERIELLKQYFHDAEVTTLDYGDILIDYAGKEIAIETKTIQDFIGSCRNGQIRKEALNMKKKCPYSFIIIYNDGKWNKHYTKPLTLNERYGNIISLMQRYKVPVVTCKNQEHFIKAIKAIMRAVDKCDIPIEQPTVRKKDSNEMVNVLIGINGVGKKMARKLLDAFKTPGGVLRASDDDLDTIPRLQEKSKASIRRMR